MHHFVNKNVIPNIELFYICSRIVCATRMGDNLRKKVLYVFKKLHRTRMNTFRGDEHALQVTRSKINEEYKKYKNVTNPVAIEELNKYAEEVEHEIRVSVIQAVEKEPGTFELRITPNTELVENVPYMDDEEKCKSNKISNTDPESSNSKENNK